MINLISTERTSEEEGESSPRKTTDRRSAQPEQEPWRSLVENEAGVSEVETTGCRYL